MGYPLRRFVDDYGIKAKCVAAMFRWHEPHGVRAALDKRKTPERSGGDERTDGCTVDTSQRVPQ